MPREAGGAEAEEGTFKLSVPHGLDLCKPTRGPLSSQCVLKEPLHSDKRVPPHPRP